MATRGVDPPNVPAPRPPAAVSGATPKAAPAGSTANAVARLPARKPGVYERPATKDAKRALGGKRAAHEPHAVSAGAAGVGRPTKRTGSEGSESSDPWSGTSLRNVLFEFTAPASGLPPMRGTEIVAILRTLLAMPSSLPNDLAALARWALGDEIDRQTALLRRRQSVV